jgi:hypothetical protein
MIHPLKKLSEYIQITIQVDQVGLFTKDIYILYIAIALIPPKKFSNFHPLYPLIMAFPNNSNPIGQWVIAKTGQMQFLLAVGVSRNQIAQILEPEIGQTLAAAGSWQLIATKRDLTSYKAQGATQNAGKPIDGSPRQRGVKGRMERRTRRNAGLRTVRSD